MIRDEIVTQTDLADAVTEALKRKKVYQSIKAQLRAEVFHTLEDKTVEVPEKPRDVFLAAELIREFLMSFDLNNTTSVFCEEMGQPPEMRVDREFLGGELGLNTLGSDSKVPLLMQLIQHLMNEKEERLCRLAQSSAAGGTNIHVADTTTSLEVETGKPILPDA